MMAASVNGMVNALGIIKHVQHINMLLLPRARQVAISEATDFLKRFDAARLAQWLPGWLAERHHRVFVDIVECRLLHSRTVAHVLLRTQQDSASPSYWLLKCYVPSRENEAHHEIALLEERSAAAGAMPSEVPKLIGHGDLLWCHYVALRHRQPAPAMAQLGRTQTLAGGASPNVTADATVTEPDSTVPSYLCHVARTHEKH